MSRRDESMVVSVHLEEEKSDSLIFRVEVVPGSDREAAPELGSGDEHRLLQSLTRARRLRHGDLVLHPGVAGDGDEEGTALHEDGDSGTVAWLDSTGRPRVAERQRLVCVRKTT